MDTAYTPSWLSTNAAIDMSLGQTHPVPYYCALQALEELIGAAPDWRAWWAPAHRERLEVGLNFYDASGKSFIRTRKYFAVEYRADYDRLAGAEQAAMGRFVTEDLGNALQIAADKGRLGPLPALPAVPTDLSRYEQPWLDADPFVLDPLGELRTHLQNKAAGGDREAAWILDEILDDSGQNKGPAPE
ncbi:hypothetical protein [Cryptosporangium aurantiacum]|uniref:Uncharacterized protein n=1 Tax=Cryptosporangium aurantiacum TaxID=134849 RepID=A0A1M7NRA1_9ACTN|nr:hypothetical protein [Cryptosporangium aurantiacum]SHN06138.1 hypothetical protein SAMN05443668_102779 [Cryptosporangium aurantiacum]